MQAVEFEASIENGIVHIPKKYKELQHSIKATFVVMYDGMTSKKGKQDIPSNTREAVDLIELQSATMQRTWENDEDKAWDAL